MSVSPTRRPSAHALLIGHMCSRLSVDINTFPFLRTACRVYTDNHLRYVAAGIIKLYNIRDTITGLKRVYATKLLSHFTARFEPIVANGNSLGTVDAIAKVATAAADKIAQGLQKVGLNGNSTAQAPAGELEDASVESDVAANGVHDSFAQEAAAQATQQQQSW